MMSTSESQIRNSYVIGYIKGLLMFRGVKGAREDGKVAASKEMHRIIEQSTCQICNNV